MTRNGNTVSRWLLDGDPAIRWHTLRDLVGASDRTVDRERGRVARVGWGGRLLARQDRKGVARAGLRGGCLAGAFLQGSRIRNIRNIRRMLYRPTT